MSFNFLSLDASEGAWDKASTSLIARNLSSLTAIHKLHCFFYLMML